MENGPFEDVFPIKNGDIPASYVSLPEGTIASGVSSVYFKLPTKLGGYDFISVKHLAFVFNGLMVFAVSIRFHTLMGAVVSNRPA